MKARSIVTLALLAGCNYDYSLIGDEPAVPGTVDEAGPDPITVAVPGGPALPAVQTTPEEPEAPVDEGQPVEEEEPAPEPTDTAEEPSYGYDTGEEPPPEEPPVEEPPPEEPPVEEPPPDTDLPPEEPPVDPPPPVEPPPPPPPPPPGPECTYELPQEWTLRTSAGGRESMHSFVGDLDGDGWEDAAWINQLDKNMNVRWGSSSGLGATPSTYSVGRGEGYIGWGDFNGDSYGDLVVSNQDSSRIQVFRGGVGRTYTLHAQVTVSNFPQRVLFQDVNRDGLVDILVGQGWTNKTVLLPATSVGTWGTPVDFVESSMQLFPGDFDGDGVDELLQGWTMKLYTLGGEPWTQSVLPDLPAGETTRKAWPVDFDGDGDPDVVAHVGDNLHAWENVDGELLHCPVTSPVPVVVGGIHPSGVGDLDGDGVLDWTSQQTCGFCGSTYFEAYGVPPIE